MKTSLFCLLFCVFHSLSYTQNCTDLAGQWQNESGSILQIDSITAEGILLGIYKSSTGVDGKSFSLQGWVNAKPELQEEKNISFSVRWQGYGSITSWTGYCYTIDGQDQIKTMWHLVRSGKEFNWERIISNSSTFTPIQD